MTRAARLIVENGTYHVMTKGNNRNNIYGTKEFVEKMKEEGLKPVGSKTEIASLPVVARNDKKVDFFENLNYYKNVI